MKKSSIFKILTLFLTFVIFSCCSGCLYSLIKKKNEEKHQHRIELQRQRKAQADALIPEVEGYTFEALPQVAFANQEDWESKGFFDIFTFFKEDTEIEYFFDVKETDLYYLGTVCSDNDGKICYEITIAKNDYKERLTKYFEVFISVYVRMTEIICIDGIFFLICWMHEYNYLDGPPAFFLLDFENNTMLYAGYAKGWLEYEIANGEFFIKEDVVYKLTKEVG